MAHLPASNAASVELALFENNLEVLNDNVDTIRDAVGEVKEIIGQVKEVLEIPENIADMADLIGKIADEGAIIARTLSNISALRTIAPVFETALKNISTQVGIIETRARTIDDRLEPLKQDVENAEQYIEERIEPRLEMASAELGKAVQSVAIANDGLDIAHRLAGLIPDNSPPQLRALRDNVFAALGVVDLAVSPANIAVGTANTLFANVESNVNSLLTTIDIDINLLGEIIDLEEALNEIEGELDFLEGPLELVGDAFRPLQPLLGAVSWLLGPVIAPLEYALNAVLRATGISGLIDDAVELLTSFIPDFDFLDEFEAELLASMSGIADLVPDLGNPIDIFVGQITSNVLLPQLTQTGRETDGDDIFLGSTADDTYLGSPGNDLLIGGLGNDVLSGGSGADTLFGGPGDDFLDGGTSGADRDVAIYAGRLADYSISRSQGGGPVYWYITDTSGGVSANSEGADVLTGIEDLIFEDEGLAIDEIDGQFITTTAVEGVVHIVSTTQGDPRPSTANADRIQGNNAFDILRGGGGNDVIIGQINHGLGGNSIGKYGDELYGEDGNDRIEVGTVYDVVSGGAGEDTAIFGNTLGGPNSIFLAVGDDAVRFRPSPSVYIAMDSVGRAGFVGDIVAKIVEIENLVGSAGPDKFWGTAGNNIIRGGLGDDHIRGLGGNDSLYGDDGADTLIGDRGNDQVFGGRGDDLFVGGLGQDQYFGGEGKDTIVYSLVTGDDAIGFLSGVSDKLAAVEFSTTGYTADGLDLPHHIIVDPSITVPGPGNILVNKYSVSGALIGQDSLESVSVLYGAIGPDVIYSSPNFGQTIYGGEGDDQLFASDFFEGPEERGAGLIGGEGDDTFVGGLGGDFIDGGEGNDTVLIAGSKRIGDNDIYAGGRDIDTLDLSASDYPWHIYFDVARNNTRAIALRPINSSDATDEKYIQPANGIAAELKSPADNTEWVGGRAQIQNFEVFIGSRFRDIISVGSFDGNLAAEVKAYGNGGDDVLFGAQTGGRLFGGDGNDTLGTYNSTRGLGGFLEQESLFDVGVTTWLDGGAGDDLFVAGDSQENFIGGEGIDTLTYEVSTAGVTVDLGSGLAHSGYAQGDSLSGIENVTGSGNDDAITGDGNANVLVGWAGADTLSGGGGDDVLYGNDGDDRLLGGDGDDALHGGEGTDTLDGGAGIDTASWAQYQLHPQGGPNLLIGDTTGVVADLQTGLAGSETLISIENLTGGAGNDRFYGDDNRNVLSGSGGNDELRGRGGDDVLLGGAGDDRLFGDAGDDWFNAGVGNNNIEGGSDRDTLDYTYLTRGIAVEMAGAGTRAGLDTGLVVSHIDEDWPVWADSVVNVADPLGGPGDLVAVGSEESREVVPGISSSAITPERIFKLNAAFAETPDDLMPIPDLPDDLPPELKIVVISRVADGLDTFKEIEVIFGSSGHDSFLGNADANEFHGNAGNDTLDGGAGNDTMEGGPGDDALEGGPGDDTAVYQGARSAFTIVALAGGAWQVVDNDAAADGNEGTDSLSNVEFVQFSDQIVDLSSLVVDTIAPTVATFSPADEAVNVAIASNIVVTFSEAIQRGTGSIVLRTAAGATIESYNATTATNLAISGSALTINPTADLSYDTAYAVEFAAGTVKDLAGNDYSGTTSYNFTTAAASVPSLSITATSADKPEGNSGVTPFTFTVTRANVLSGSTTVNWGMTAGANPGADGADFGGAYPGGVVTFAAGESTKIITVNVSGDTVYESGGIAENFIVTLFDASDGAVITTASALGRIQNDDANDEGTVSTILGTAGDDALNGTHADDRMEGLGGNDALYGSKGNDTLDGGAGDDYLRGDADLVTSKTGSGADSLIGGDGNDTLDGGAGDDTLDGGAGADTAVYGGARSGYTIPGAASGIVTGPDGTDTVTSIERYQFSDKNLAFDLALGQPTGNTVRIDGAAFDFFTPVYVGIGLQWFDGGVSMLEACERVVQFMGQTNTGFVNTVYTNVVGMAPTPAQLDLYVGLLEGGGWTQAALLEFAASHPVNELNIDLVGLQQTGVEFVYQ